MSFLDNMKYLADVLDRTTMYRTVLYVLFAWAGISLGMSLAGFLFYKPLEILASLLVLLVVSVVAHYIFAYLFRAPANIESTLITALILFFIFDPVFTLSGLSSIAAIGVLAIAGKYIVAWKKLHILNPVVFAAVAAALLGIDYATWWIGNVYLLPFVLLGGFVIVSKIRRWPLVLSVIASALIVRIIFTTFSAHLEWSVLWTFFASWPILFFAFVMVTEPLSTPAGTKKHVLYGALAGALSSMPFVVGPLYSSPELALLIANIVFWPLSLKGRLELKFVSIKEIAKYTYEFVFESKNKFKFTAGQYLEWTLPHKPDKRGIRRYFTIASAPEERNIKLGLKIPKNSSSFKKKLEAMKIGEIIFATSLDGDFVLPKDQSVPIVFIAGGIGVTPFRSMIKSVEEKKEKREITVFYCNKAEEDIAYREIFNKNEWLKRVDVLSGPSDSWKGEKGFITEEMIKKYVENPTLARYYISGPPGMVDAYKKLLKGMDIKNGRIVTDYFPGLG